MCEWHSWDVRGAGLDWWCATFVLQLFTEPQTLWRKFENIGHGLESSRTGEATSGCNRGVAVKVHVQLQCKHTTQLKILHNSDKEYLTMFYRYLCVWMCAVTYLFEMEVSKTWPLWTPRQLGEWDSLPSPTHLPCVRGMFVRVHERVCEWVCERMCCMGEVCVGVREGVSGVYEAEARGTGDKSIHTHRPSQLANIILIT